MTSRVLQPNRFRPGSLASQQIGSNFFRKTLPRKDTDLTHCMDSGHLKILSHTIKGEKKNELPRISIIQGGFSPVIIRIPSSFSGLKRLRWKDFFVPTMSAWGRLS
jgi:hypothetical protein